MHTVQVETPPQRQARMPDISLGIQFSLAILFTIAIIPLLLSTETISAAEATRPNIVFIIADDLGYGDLGCFGCPDINTPYLDRLAKEGVRLTSNYSNSAVCSPTRAAFMTGRYFQRIGLEWAVWYQAPREGLPPQEKSLATLLKQAGYATAISGKWHLGYSDGWRPAQHGFDHSFGCLGGNVNYFEHYDKTDTHDLFLNDQPLHADGYVTDLTAEYAIRFLREMQDGPFFLYLPFNAPHFPFQGPDDADRKFAWHNGTRADQYAPMVQRLDEAIGRIVSVIDELKLAEETLIVFTSDNGGESLARNAPLRGGKGTLWEGGIRVPAIARWPGRIPADTECDEPVQTIDWSATILALAGGHPTADRPFDGVDLMPVLTGRGSLKTRPLYFRRALDPHRNNVKPQRAVRYGTWKYLDTPSGDRFLFDLADDPQEQQNSIDRHLEMADRLRAMLDEWEHEVDPPLYDQRKQALKNKAQRQQR